MDKIDEVPQQLDRSDNTFQSWQKMIMMGNPSANKIIVKSKLQMKISFCNFFEIQQREAGEEDGSMMVYSTDSPKMHQQKYEEQNEN